MTTFFISGRIKKDTNDKSTEKYTTEKTVPAKQWRRWIETYFSNFYEQEGW